MAPEHPGNLLYVSPFLSPDSAGLVPVWPGGHFCVGRLLSLGQQWRGSQGDEAGAKVPFLLCTRGVGEVSCLCSLGGVGCAGK